MFLWSKTGHNSCKSHSVRRSLVTGLASLPEKIKSHLSSMMLNTMCIYLLAKNPPCVFQVWRGIVKTTQLTLSMNKNFFRNHAPYRQYLRPAHIRILRLKVYIDTLKIKSNIIINKHLKWSAMVFFKNMKSFMMTNTFSIG
jgi:hypothetical protein